MKITGSSTSTNSLLWDPVRLQWVAATPEEKVRQDLLQKMIGPLGFPKGLISVEKQTASERRVDLLCHAAVQGKIVPLLLVECKAIKMNRAAQEQAFGYNNSIQAPFVCLANQEGVKTLWKVQNKIDSVPFLPSYEQLVGKLCLLFKM